MFLRKKYVIELQEENRRLREVNENSNRYYERERLSTKRIKNSKVVFEKIKGVDNLYIDDRLDTGYELVIYNSKTSIENPMTRGLSRYEAENIPGVNVIGYLEMDYWDEEKGHIDISKLFVYPQYRRRGYASRILERLIECARFYDVKTIALSACASDGIEQGVLEGMYYKFGFKKQGESSNRMICELK